MSVLRSFDIGAGVCISKSGWRDMYFYEHNRNMTLRDHNLAVSMIYRHHIKSYKYNTLICNHASKAPSHIIQISYEFTHHIIYSYCDIQTFTHIHTIYACIIMYKHKLNIKSYVHHVHIAWLVNSSWWLRSWTMMFDCCHTVDISFARNRCCHVDTLWMIWLLYNAPFFLRVFIWFSAVASSIRWYIICLRADQWINKQ